MVIGARATRYMHAPLSFKKAIKISATHTEACYHLLHTHTCTSSSIMYVLMLLIPRCDNIVSAVVYFTILPATISVVAMDKHRFEPSSLCQERKGHIMNMATTGSLQFIST